MGKKDIAKAIFKSREDQRWGSGAQRTFRDKEWVVHKSCKGKGCDNKACHDGFVGGK